MVVDNFLCAHCFRIPSAVCVFGECHVKSQLAGAACGRIYTMLSLVAGDDKVLDVIVFQYLQQFCFMEGIRRPF